VIVGSGPGGSAAAARLAEAGKRVVMLEAGSYYPLGSFSNLGSESLRKLYIERGQLAAASPAGTFVPMAAGEGVGGSTLVNSAMCFRGPTERLEEWSELVGNERYGPDRMAPLYEEIEATIHVAPTTDKPIIAGQNNLKTAEGVRILGLEGGMVDRNAPGCVGCAVCFYGCPVGGKGSMDRNFLGARAFNHDCELYANAPVEEILIENGRAVGVRARIRDPETRHKTYSITVRARIVLIAGGAIGTAKLLLTTKVSENEHIGRHLRMHPTGSVYAYFDEDINIWRGVTQGSYGHHLDHPDVLVEAFSVGAEILFAQAVAKGQNAKDFLANVRQMAGTGFLIRDESEGRITMADRGKAAIFYELIPRDLEKMNVGFQLCCEVMFAAGARSVKPGLWYAEYGDSMDQVNADLARLTDPNDIYLYASHLQGTCRMATRPEDGVVDSRGSVFDVPGLYIADSSVFPNSLGRNPQMTVMAVALNVAEQLLEDW